MAENVYECNFIFNANTYAKNPAGVGKAVEEMVKAVDGEILASRLWNEQKLAYPINGHRKGAYWLTYARLESTTISKLNRACQLNDGILRHLVIKIDPRLVDTMVAVAKVKQYQTLKSRPKKVTMQQVRKKKKLFQPVNSDSILLQRENFFLLLTKGVGKESIMVDRNHTRYREPIPQNRRLRSWQATTESY